MRIANAEPKLFRRPAASLQDGAAAAA
eukprot:SAG22_NODE_8118_length_681_cov_1.487973_1_plen_26_part_01